MPHFPTLDPRLILTEAQLLATEQAVVIEKYRAEKLSGDSWSFARAWINHDGTTVVEFQRGEIDGLDVIGAPRPVHVVAEKKAGEWSLYHYEP